MGFEDKYISDKENSEKPDAKRIVISNDAYAIGEQIDILVKKLMELLRRI
jgi:hypothetical protein